ncbi:hypothetical protein NX784_28655 [Massilia pinisoli]|uniref:Uncharacterized protein n=1 Tax=Massilia pinisoli TaxID=1772194 RepID=A0ABT2A0C6_9BURK|nr:hypothetical protein [Massilia pinisoli]MCS0585556.1 hypothetical protein [Massilia pinisoli]
MIRDPYAVFADFGAFQRFKQMNNGARSTSWSRGREIELGAALRYELGSDAVAQLEAWKLISPKQSPEDECIAIIKRALIEMGDRDVPQTLPADGSWL